MSIGIEPGPGRLAGATGSALESEAFVAELTRMANAMFRSGGPGSAPPFVPRGADEPGVSSAPHPGPSAMAPGLSGMSTAQSAPPTPGFLSSPPIASAPPPKEADLRSIGALLAEPLHTQPVRLAEAAHVPQPDNAPYFLALAGMPSGGSLQAPGHPQAPGHWSGHGGAGQHLSGATPSTRQGVGTTTNPALQQGLPLGAPLPSSAIPGAADFAPQLVAYRSEAPVAPARQSSSLFDPQAVKRDFPILRERVNGRALVWLDNAATTQKPNAVIERLQYFYEHENSNIHRGAHTLAARATDAYEGARDKVRRFINAPSVKDVIFVRGATEGINLVAQSWGRRNIESGDEIVISWLEHHANIVPWQQLCSEKGARLRVAPVDAHGQVILEEYAKLLGPRTKLVSLTQVSNALGTIVPVQEMTQMAQRYGACVLIDGAQAVSHLRADVQALDCEFYVFSGHKVFGPTGIGALYGKTAVLEHMPPWQGGGNMIQDVTFEKTVYQAAPNRFEAGTGNIADAVGLGAALDYVTGLGIENIARYEHELLEYGTERLREVPGLTLIGTAADKAGVLSFVLDGQRTEEVGGMLNQEGIAVRSGHHCAQPILRRFGLEGTVRASLAPYNTREDLDLLAAALHRIQLGRPRR
jgi:cysteine desulfurase/selenocysteine lyase